MEKLSFQQIAFYATLSIGDMEPEEKLKHFELLESLSAKNRAERAKVKQQENIG